MLRLPNFSFLTLAILSMLSFGCTPTLREEPTPDTEQIIDTNSTLDETAGPDLGSEQVPDNALDLDGDAKANDSEAPFDIEEFPTSCLWGTADCNAELKDGCEVDLQSDADHCGSCGRSCGEGQCRTGFCVPEVLVAEPCTQTRIAPDGVTGFLLDGERLYWIAHRSPAGAGCSNEPAIPEPHEGERWITEPGLRWLDKAEPKNWGEHLRMIAFPRRMVRSKNRFVFQTHYYVFSQPPEPYDEYYDPVDLYSFLFDPEWIAPATEILAEQELDIVGLAVRNGQAYWAQTGSDGAIWSVPIEGGEVSKIVADPTIAWGPALDDTHVYWCSGAAQQAPDCGQSLMRAPLDGSGAVEELSEDGCAAIARDSSRVVEWIVTDGDDVFFISRSDCLQGDLPGGTLVRRSTSTGHVTEIANDVWAFAVDESHLYVASCSTAQPGGCTPELVRFTREGNDRIVLFQGDYDSPDADPWSPRPGANRSPDALQVDDTHIYWVDDGRTAARILRVAK